jgi:virginiamycin B lyase
VEFVVPTPGGYPYRLTAAPDGGLWFGELYGNKIGRMSLTGAFSEFPIPTPESWPSGVAVAPDATVWFT